MDKEEKYVNQHCSVEKRSCHTKPNLYFVKNAQLDVKGTSQDAIFLEWGICTADPVWGCGKELIIPLFPPVVLSVNPWCYSLSVWNQIGSVWLNIRTYEEYSVWTKKWLKDPKRDL